MNKVIARAIKDTPFDYAAHCAARWELCACEVMFPGRKKPARRNSEFHEENWWDNESNWGGSWQ